MKLSSALFVLALVLACGNLSAAPRKWNDRTGEFAITAEFIRFKNGKVYIEKADGEVVGVPIEKLSYADYDYLRGLPEMRDYVRQNPLPTQYTLVDVKFKNPLEWLDFSPDSRFVAGATNYGMQMLNIEKKSHVLTPVSDKPVSYLSFCKFTPDGRTLVACSKISSRVTTWTVDSEGRLSREKSFVVPQGGKVLCMAFHPDGQYVVSGGDMANSLCYWNLNTGEMKYSFEKMFSGNIEGCCINPKGTQAVATDGNFAILFDLEVGKPIQKMQLTKAHTYRTDISADGKRIFAEYSGTVYGWTTLDGQGRLQVKLLGGGSTRKLKSSADGNFFLTRHSDAFDLWNAVNGQRVHRFLPSGGTTRIMAFSPNHRLIAGGSGIGGSNLQIFRNPAVPD